jgi:glycosyltransferase involved in cell wall biosynthesis
MTGARRPSKILFLHGGSEMYGADRVLLGLVEGLSREELTPLIVLPGEGPLADALRRLGVPVRIMELGVLRRRYMTPAGILNRAWHVLKAVRGLTGIIREEEVDLVHTCTTAVLAGALAARRTGVPHVWHVLEITTRPAFYRRFIAWAVPRWSAAVVATAAAVKSHMEKGHPLNRGKTTVVHHGIDPGPFQSASPEKVRRELGLAPGTVLAGMVGRVNWWKGQHALLDTAGMILSRRDDVRFLLVGGTFEGEERLMAELRERAGREGLAGNVFVSDFRDDAPEVFAALDIFVLPSTEPDPQPTVLLEAMAAGKPVVSFAHGGAMEMIEDGVTGLLVPVGDTAALAAAIERLAGDAGMRRAMGRAGRERLAARFSRAAFIRGMAGVYDALLESGRHKP